LAQITPLQWALVVHLLIQFLLQVRAIVGTTLYFRQSLQPKAVALEAIQLLPVCEMELQGVLVVAAVLDQQVLVVEVVEQAGLERQTKVLLVAMAWKGQLTPPVVVGVVLLRLAQMEMCLQETVETVVLALRQQLQVLALPVLAAAADALLL
jgi:hypothetical protein